MDKKLLLLIKTAWLFALLSGCGGSDGSKHENQEQNTSDIPQTLTPVVLTPVQPSDDQAPVTIGDSGNFWPNGSPLSATYEKYFSGYWRGGSCGGNGFARIGINGTSAELNLGASFTEPMFGSVSSNGEFLFSSRDVSWDCQECGEVRPLETTGTINWEVDSGSIKFEVACSNGIGHLVSSIIVGLKGGITQPDPSNELIRIQSETVALIGDSPSCVETSHCKLISLKSGDFCKHEALAYSALDSDEAALIELKTEYRANEWLAYGQRESSTTLCGSIKEASCELGKCI